MLDSLSPAQRRNYLFLLLTAGCYFCGLSFLLLLPKYLRGMGATEEQLGWLVGAPLIPFLLLAPLAGNLADRISARRLAIGGLLLTGGSQLAFIWVDGVNLLAYLLRLLGGAGHAFVFTSIFAMVARSLSAEYKAQGVAYFTVVIQAGNILGSFLGALALSRYGGTAFFVISTVLVGGAIALAAQVRPEQAGEHDPAEDTPAGSVLRRPVVGALTLILVLGGAFGMVLQFVPTYLDFLYESGQVALPIASIYFLTTALLTVALVRLIFGRRVYQAGNEPLLSLCMVGLPVSILLLQAIQGPISSVLVSVAFGLSYGLLFPAANALVLLRVDRARQGRASGLLSMLFEVGFRGFGFIMGPIAQYLGYSVMFQVLAGLLLLGYAAFFLLEDNRRRWVLGSPQRTT